MKNDKMFPFLAELFFFIFDQYGQRTLYRLLVALLCVQETRRLSTSVSLEPTESCHENASGTERPTQHAPEAISHQTKPAVT